ncbi:MAG: 4a-hydroxytetrahydrobiopterin dehydratase [Magnetococcales bacterium]|nr:4a-hydroxytetrahydrobiopterin dehydratase [Magnetococcales bacterium]
MNGLLNKKCKPCEGGLNPYTSQEAQSQITQIPGWTLEDGDKTIYKIFYFKDFYQTMAFVNALAYIAHNEDHHPNLAVGYNSVKVFYSTHAIDGLSQNDFICAAKINELAT